MDSCAWLVGLILASGLTSGELEKISRGYLGLEGERFGNVLGNGAGSWEAQVTDLVQWADRQAALVELTQGVLNFVADRRAAQDYLRTNYMPTGIDGSSSLERRMERLEDHVNGRMLAMEQEIRRLAVAIEAREHHDGGVNWSVIFLAILVALIVAGATTTMAVMR